MDGCTPGTCRQATTSLPVSDTTASYVLPSALSMSTTAAVRSSASPGRCASTVSLGGSWRAIETTRVRGPSVFCDRRISQAPVISSAVSGSSGWVARALATAVVDAMVVLSFVGCARCYHLRNRGYNITRGARMLRARQEATPLAVRDGDSGADVPELSSDGSAPEEGT